MTDWRGSRAMTFRGLSVRSADAIQHKASHDIEGHGVLDSVPFLIYKTQKDTVRHVRAKMGATFSV